ncbi:MAG: hypothetical protein DRG25_05905, partial [Deltaproteobacteria bacterium]
MVIEDIDIPKVQDGDVLVKIVASGLCHTDLHVIKGDMPVPMPVVLGHEGAGIVTETGKGVTTVKPGDHVVIFAMPTCGRCEYCQMGKGYLCTPGYNTIFAGTLMDGTKRLRTQKGKELNHFFGQSSFAEYCLVKEGSVVKVREDAPLEKLGGFGCGITTGVGAVLNTARVEAGDSVAVFGCGSLGLSAISAARLAGATTIIAIDILENKLNYAREFGATHTINASKVDPVKEIINLTGSGVKYAFEFIGNVKVMEQTFNSICPGGKAIILGSPRFGEKVSIDAVSLLLEKTLMGTAEGSSRPMDITRYVDLYMDKKLEVDKLITKNYSLEEINQAFKDLEEG